jgi:hypothetical protein
MILFYTMLYRGGVLVMSVSKTLSLSPCQTPSPDTYSNLLSRILQLSVLETDTQAHIHIHAQTHKRDEKGDSNDFSSRYQA